ncbi:MAG: tryptophan synthase subunit alpha [Candidatus Omnitrophica bacterium]|nr:tryptophan synthase subunit alpha [Candidatus Omnitrophota bacterium]
MNRIREKFLDLKKKRGKALIFYMTAGDPSLAANQALIPFLEKEGADLIELGVPFSDPLADGPVIQAASQRALKRGTTLPKILTLVRNVRKKSQIPVLLMSYLNPLMQYGYERFAKDAKAAGVDGVIVPDLPPEEERVFVRALKGKKLDLVYLLAPTTGPARRRVIAKASSGFIYYVSVTGVTGARRQISPSLRPDLSAAKKASRLPLCVGFGIATPGQAKAAAAGADGVIIGSALVRALEKNSKMSHGLFAKKFAAPFARALGKAV